MEILAIESSTSRGSLALWRDGRLVAVEEFQSERAHNSVLFGPLEAVLRQAEALDLIVCGTGPGSYSGVRVGRVTDASNPKATQLKTLWLNQQKNRW